MSHPSEQDELRGDPTEPTSARESGAFREQLVAGATIGRYVVVKHLGAGGMGVVFAAYDPRLDRKVALKVLHADRSSGANDHTRLLREAQALARLSHPNVVAVHDVGTHEGRVWIAMEFVAGKTLSLWIRGRKPTWRELVVVIVQAARGLAAAHHAGLVHRDVKPDNLMVEADGGVEPGIGRVRVMDFGLARAAGQQRNITGNAPVHAALSSSVTVAGALVGTPAYMAPEQLTSAGADAHSDQFALCVTAWEALFGERPFAGDSFVSYAANVVAGRIEPPKRSGAAPRWLRRVLERGLASDPKARWPSMSALADAIDRSRDRSRKRLLAGVAAIAVVGTTATIVGGNVATAARRGECEREGAGIYDAWNPEIAARVRTAMLATSAAGAAATYDRVAPRLDGYALRWQELRTGLCTSAVVEETASVELHALGAECLDHRRLALETHVDLLANADVEVVTNAVSAAVMLEALDACVDEAWLRRRPRPPVEPGAREKAASLRVGVVRVRALDATGHEKAALALAVELSAELDEASPELAELRQQIAQLETDFGHYERSVELGREAFFTALAVGADEVATDAANELGFTLGHHLSRPDEGEPWARIGLTLMQRLGEDDGPRASSALDTIATLNLGRGKLDEAQAMFEQVLAMRERLFGPDHPFVAQSLQQLASVFETRGDLANAEKLYARALATEEQCLGPDHPLVANGLDRLGVVRFRLGDDKGAETMLLRAIAIAEAARGPDHLDVGVPLNSLATVYKKTGNLDAADAMYRRALPIFEHAMGDDHLYVGQVLRNLGHLQVARGAPADAERTFARVLAIREHVLGADDPALVDVLVSLATAAGMQSRAADAIAFAERAVAIGKRGAGQPALLAEAEAALGRARSVAVQPQ